MLKVKQIASSKIDKNLVIHSPAKWEGATVLGIASHEGHMDIVKYLVESGTSVNFSDPCMGRNSLHWACIGNQMSIAKYLIESGACVNHVDKDRVTPLVQATLCQNIELVTLLIRHGANTNLVDRLQCSPLHYACKYRNPYLVEKIIKSGCILNNYSSFIKGTPFSNIWLHMDMNLCRLLLDAGYSLKNDAWFFQNKGNLDCCHRSTEELIVHQKQIKPLSYLCRVEIRKLFKGINLEKSIDVLEVPSELKSFLKFDDN